MTYPFTVRVCLNAPVVVECDKPIAEIREIARKLAGFTEQERLHLAFSSVTVNDTLFPHSRVHHSQELMCVLRELPPVVIWYDQSQWMVLDLHCPHIHGCTHWKLHPLDRYFHISTYEWKSTDRVWICETKEVCPLSSKHIPRISIDTLNFYMDLVQTGNHEYFSFDRITEVGEARDRLRETTSTRSVWTSLLPLFLRDKEIEAYRLWLERCGEKQMKDMLSFLVDIVYDKNDKEERKVEEWWEEWEQFYVAVERRERDMEIVTRHTFVFCTHEIKKA